MVNSESLPENFDDYHMIRKLGRGAMGIVYEAMQVSLGRNVAIKILAPHLSIEKEFKDRFFREARLAAQINHPNVVQIYRVGEYKGTLFIVMEYIEGTTLREKVAREKGFDPVDKIMTIKTMAQALYEAEKRNIVHRDLKPSNIMVSDIGVLKIMDFGLSKIHSSSSSSLYESMTGKGILIGTPQFMSPEQIKGEKVDSRGDIYSTGIIFFYILTKKVPFDGDLAPVLNKQLNESLPDPREVNPRVPPSFSSMMYMMTEKNPKNRFQSFRQVIEAADECLDELQPGANKTGVRKKTKKLLKAREEKTVISSSGRRSILSEKKKDYAIIISIGIFLCTLAYFFVHVVDLPMKMINEKLESRPQKPGYIAFLPDERADFLNIFPARSSEDRYVGYWGICSGCGKKGFDYSLVPSENRTFLQYFKCPQCGTGNIVSINVI